MVINFMMLNKVDVENYRDIVIYRRYIIHISGTKTIMFYMLASIVATGRIVETFCGSFSRHKFPLNLAILIISTSLYLGFRI